MFNFKIGDNVIFKWNNSIFFGIINGIKDNCVYFVEFPPNSPAGMYDIIRPIHKEYLIPNELHIIEKKIIIKI